MTWETSLVPTAPRLRVAVVGAGIVGCYLGGRLSAVADVTLIGRPAVLEAIAAGGLVLESSADRQEVPAERLTLSQSAEAVRDADIVLVCTKSGSSTEATRQFAPYLRRDAAVIGFQNGLHCADLIREGVGEDLVLAGCIPFNVARTGPATYRRTSSGRIVVERHPASERLVAAMRQSGLSVCTSRDMQAVLHGKVLFNLNNAVQALSGLPLRSELLNRNLRCCLALCQSEALRVFSAAGVIPRVPLAVPAHLMPTALRLPSPLFRAAAAATLRVDPLGTSSMADDLRAGRRTEVEDLQGEIVRMGARLGVNTPVCTRVVELVHEAESAGRDFRPWDPRILRDELIAARRAPRHGSRRFPPAPYSS